MFSVLLSPLNSIMMPSAPRACPPTPPVSFEDGEPLATCSANASTAINPFKPEPLPSLLDASSPLLFHENTSSSGQFISAQSIPLRGRDLHVLTELFNQNEIEAIESDILQNLDWRCPEPCWEDDPFEFLREYL